MAKSSTEVEELQAWLEANKFGQFFDKLYECGVESLNDLRMLESEEDVQELAGPQGINMGVVFRRKFIKAVLGLGKPVKKDDSANPPETLSPTPDNDEPTPPDQSKLAKKRTSNVMSRAEEQALSLLVDQIRIHTQQLRKTRDDLSNVARQTEDSRQNLTEVFDKAMGVLLVRRKQLEQALTMAETETNDKLKKRVLELQKSAQTLLKCKSTVELKLRKQKPDKTREQFVTGAVEKSLSEAPKEQKVSPNILFDQGDTPLIEFLENYGAVGVARKKGTSASPPQ